MLCRITRITTPEGYPVTGGRALARIGREGLLIQLAEGRPMLLAYTRPGNGLILQTSAVQEIRGQETRELQVTTCNSVYTLLRLDGIPRDCPAVDRKQEKPPSGVRDRKGGAKRSVSIMERRKGKVKMMQLKMRLKNETKTCYRFERKDENGNLITLYLKKADVESAGIDPKKGIIVTIEEGNEDA